MVEPVRLQLSRKRGFDLQAWSREVNGLPAVNVARPSRHGNPFRINGWFRMGSPPNIVAGRTQMAYSQCLMPEDPDHRRGYTKILDNAMAVAWFRNYRERYPLPESDRLALRGNNLACHCGAGLPCHADVLIELANKE